MKKLLFFTICISGFMSAQTFSNTTQTFIPDNNLTGVQSDIPVNISGTITDPSKVFIKMDLAHTWSGDLTIALLRPGQSATGPIALIKRMGTSTVGSSSKFISGEVITFNAAATNFVNIAGSTIPAGTYKPTAGTNVNPTDYTVADLSSLFSNLAINGTWSLKLFDSSGGDLGRLNNWQIVFEAGALLGIDTSVVSNPGLSVLGNPFTETLNLKINSLAKEVKFNIYSMDGKKVYSYEQNSSKNTNGELKISTDKWSTGMYILSPIVNGEKLMNIKLLKK